MSAPIRELYAHVCDTMAGCPPLVALLDAERPFRRIQMGEERGWTNILTYGRAIRRPYDVAARRPIWTFLVSFVPLIRGEAEASTAGDLILADIEGLLMALFSPAHPGDVARVLCGGRPPSTIIILDSLFDEFSSEPIFDDVRQAWTQTHRFRFDVVVPTCREPAPWCFTCP